MKGIIAIIVLVVGIACAEDAARSPIVYKTQRGDTLDSIAKRFRMKPQHVAALNPGTRFDLLQIGQPIKVTIRTGSAPLLYPTLPPQLVPRG